MSEGPGGFFSRGGLWVIVQFVLMGLVLFLGVAFRGAGMGVLAQVTGGGLFVAGAWFGIAGTLVLGRNRTAFPRPREEANLVESGIYARVRHPLYTSVMFLSSGWALLWQSSPALVVAFASVPFFYAKAKTEERWLKEKFPGYAEYAKAVPRFIPRLKRGRKHRG